MNERELVELQEQRTKPQLDFSRVVTKVNEVNFFIGMIKHTVKRVRKDVGKREERELASDSEREHPRLKVKGEPKKGDK